MAIWLRTVRQILAPLFMAITLIAGVSTAADAQSVRPPANAVENAAPKADPAGPPPTDRIWSEIRKGTAGRVTIPDANSAILVNAEGESWRNLRNGPLASYGAWALAGMVLLLSAFYLFRGQIKLSHGWSGRTIERFSDIERASHWLMAVSFIILGLTGLNMVYGRYVLLPVIGKDAFASLTAAGKWAHNYVAFAFMVGLLLSFVMWVKHNFPNKHDVTWLAQAGGLFSKDAHPPAKKFNAGQKILFWLVMLGGLSISISGLALMFPFQTTLFAKTFGVLNIFGLGLPKSMTPMQEMQYATVWHNIVGIFLVVVILGHIYIGTIGMQGAFDAMGSGQVDVQWAKEHHSIWAEEELAKQASGSLGVPRGGLAVAAGAATVAAVAHMTSGSAPPSPQAGLIAQAQATLPSDLKPASVAAKPGDVVPLPQYVRKA